MCYRSTYSGPLHHFQAALPPVLIGHEGRWLQSRSGRRGENCGSYWDSNSDPSVTQPSSCTDGDILVFLLGLLLLAVKQPGLHGCSLCQFGKDTTGESPDIAWTYLPRFLEPFCCSWLLSRRHVWGRLHLAPHTRETVA
jgi:hypothetical protein